MTEMYLGLTAFSALRTSSRILKCSLLGVDVVHFPGLSQNSGYSILDEPERK